MGAESTWIFVTVWSHGKFVLQERRVQIEGQVWLILLFISGHYIAHYTLLASCDLPTIPLSHRLTLLKSNHTLAPRSLQIGEILEVRTAVWSGRLYIQPALTMIIRDAAHIYRQLSHSSSLFIRKYTHKTRSSSVKHSPSSHSHIGVIFHFVL